MKRQNLPLCGSISGFCSNEVSRNRKATGLVFAGLPVTHTFLELLSFRSISIISLSEAHSKIVRDNESLPTPVSRKYGRFSSFYAGNERR